MGCSVLSWIFFSFLFCERALGKSFSLISMPLMCPFTIRHSTVFMKTYNVCLNLTPTYTLSLFPWYTPQSKITLSHLNFICLFIVFSHIIFPLGEALLSSSMRRSIFIFYTEAKMLQDSLTLPLKTRQIFHVNSCLISLCSHKSPQNTSLYGF